MAAAPTTTSAAFTLRTRFVDDERTPEEILTVQSRDCFFSFRVVPDFREAEAARLSSKPISKKRQRIRLHADLRKQRSHLSFRSLER